MKLNIKHLPNLEGYEENGKILNWFGTNGIANILYKPNSISDLSTFFKQKSKEIPIEIIGSCSNTLISDAHIPGVTIKLQSKDFTKIIIRNNIVSIGAGCLDSTVSNVAAENCLSGLEFLSTIPGTIGGAIKMNAGSFNQETFDSLISVLAMKDNGEIIQIPKEKIKYGYRNSDIDGIILGGNFRLQKKSTEKIKIHMANILEKKNNSQPVREKTGGSTFHNLTIEDYFQCGTIKKAWEFIKNSGAFKETCGEVYISSKHCNFIINKGTCAKDINDLIVKIQEIVFNKFHVLLKIEIKKIGIW